MPEQDSAKKELFETMPIPSAVSRMCVPMVVTSLVTVVYNMADTYFVGLLGDPVQSAAVTAAMNSFNKELLSDHIRTCVARDIREGKDETIDELLNVLQKLMK